MLAPVLSDARNLEPVNTSATASSAARPLTAYTTTKRKEPYSQRRTIRKKDIKGEALGYLEKDFVHSGQRHSQPPLVAEDSRAAVPQTTDTYLVDMSCYRLLWR